jgi:hypothetical protein
MQQKNHYIQYVFSQDAGFNHGVGALSVHRFLAGAAHKKRESL